MLKIAIVVGMFPALSETFIVNHVVGLIESGNEVTILSLSRPVDSKVHKVVLEYELLGKTIYAQPRYIFTSKTLRRAFKALNALLVVLKCFFRDPTRTLEVLRLIMNNGIRAAVNSILLLPHLGISKNGFDVIHCHFGPMGLCSLPFKHINPTVKFFASFHGYDVNKFPLLFGNNIYDELFVMFDGFTANSEYTRKKIVELGCPENKIRTIPVSIRVGSFAYRERSLAKDEEVRFLTVARLVAVKGHEYSIRAIAKYHKDNPNIVYNIAGDGPLLNHLEKLVLDSHASDYINFLGPLDQSQVAHELEDAHIFILTSIIAEDGAEEGQALVLQEAQAAGLPIISTLSGGIPEGVIDGITGFLVPERDVESTYDKVKYLAEHPEIWPEMGMQGASFVKSKYDIGTVSSELCRMYDE